MVTSTHSDLKNLFIMFELCQSLIRTEQLNTFYLIDGLVRLVLTLRVSITTTKRFFLLAMKIITRLHNRMKDNIFAII